MFDLMPLHSNSPAPYMMSFDSAAVASGLQLFPGYGKHTTKRQIMWPFIVVVLLSVLWSTGSHAFERPHLASAELRLLLFDEYKSNNMDDGDVYRLSSERPHYLTLHLLGCWHGTSETT
jgi:hypothetical protein